MTWSPSCTSVSGEKRPPPGPSRGQRQCDPLLPIRVRTWHQAADRPGSSDYRSMERWILFLLICIGKGLSWMVREVKFKAQRCFEGQWEGRLMMGGCEGEKQTRLKRVRHLQAPAIFLIWKKVCCCCWGSVPCALPLTEIKENMMVFN